MTTQANHTFKTTETALATYLLIEGFTPKQIDYSKSQYEFIFDNYDNSVQSTVNKYLTSTARVDPATYHRINRLLMRCIKGELQWGEINV